jgi:hypothetical protein
MRSETFMRFLPALAVLSLLVELIFLAVLGYESRTFFFVMLACGLLSFMVGAASSSQCVSVR